MLIAVLAFQGSKETYLKPRVFKAKDGLLWKRHDTYNYSSETKKVSTHGYLHGDR